MRAISADHPLATQCRTPELNDARRKTARLLRAAGGGADDAGDAAMSADLVTIAELAALARVTEARARKVCREFMPGGPRGPRRAWRGAVLRIHPGPLVEFSSLPADLRDAALVARDQLLLPLPPRNTIRWNGLRLI